jgi:hypothetical protein
LISRPENVDRFIAPNHAKFGFRGLLQGTWVSAQKHDLSFQRSDLAKEALVFSLQAGLLLQEFALVSQTLFPQEKANGRQNNKKNDNL